MIFPRKMSDRHKNAEERGNNLLTIPASRLYREFCSTPKETDVHHFFLITLLKGN
jgi:hypothetical protein